MFAVLRRRNFGLLWFGQVISVAGDWLLFASLAYYVYELTGSALATGAMLIASTLPRILLGSVAGVFVDRWDRRRTMILSDLLRAVLLLALLAVHSPADLWILYVVAVLESAISQFFVPARNALLPHLVDAGQLVTANSLNSVGGEVARLTGPALGGLMLARLGLSSIVLGDSASFLVSALLLALITARPPVSQAPHQAGVSRWAAVWEELLAGFSLVRRQRLVGMLFLVYAISMVGEGLLDVLIAPYVRLQLQGDALAFGWLLSAQAIGGILGGSLIASLGRHSSPTRMVALGALGWGIVDLAIFNTRMLPVALLLMMVVGLPLAGLGVGVNALLQREVPDQFRGRVFGALSTTGALMMLLGMGLSSALADRVGVVPMLDVACVVLVLSGLVALAGLPAAPKGVGAASA